MKKLFILFTLIFTGFATLRAQQDPMFTQYMFNEIVVNPAYAGSHKVISATLLYRTQWVGFEGNPTTQTFNVHSPLKNERIGVGLSIVNDEIGVTNNFNLYANGSYMIPINSTSHIAFGLQGGFTHVRTQLGSIRLGDEEPDPEFEGDVATGFLPNVGAGVHYETDKMYAGFSVPKLIPVSKTTDQTRFEQVHHYFLTAGLLIDLNPLWMLKPAFMVKAVRGAPVNADISLDIIYDQTFTLGVAYRSLESLDFMAMYQINNEFRIGYAYDMVLNGLRDADVRGSHEIVVNYRFSHDKSKVITPRFF